MYDTIIIGSGPAGLSAAITLKARNKSVLVVSNSRTGSGLYKARVVDNYPGLPGISGAELSGKMFAHAQGMGVEIVSGRVTGALKRDSGVSVAYGSEAAEGRTLILALGAEQPTVFPGEAAYLGRGVSYCATCDGMLYRGKRVVVAALSPNAREEADYLRDIGCDVFETVSEKIEIRGGAVVASAVIDGNETACDAVFILRNTVTPTVLLADLEIKDGYIVTGRDMSTNIPGVFAAGDCTGTPLQIAKAAGEGQIAALTVVKYLNEVKECLTVR